MSTDRELLEAAARAVGLRLTWGEKHKVGEDEVDCTDIPYVESDSPDEAPWYWNPLEDDGDALRLSVATGEPFVVRTGCVTTMGGLIEMFDRHAGREAEMRAVRRLIVRAAASLTPPRTSGTGDLP